MKQILFLLLFLFPSTFAFSQLEKKMAKKNVVSGSIIKNGEEHPGYIKKVGVILIDGLEAQAPWEFQTAIRFISKADFEGKEKIKGRDFERYNAKEIEGYTYDTGEEVLRFESVKYSGLSDLGINVLAETKFMLKVFSGKISLYHHFRTPSDNGDSDQVASYEESQVPELIYKKGEDGQLNSLGTLNVKKELADCPTVVDKYKNNQYKVVGDESSKTKVNKFLNKVLFQEQVLLLVIEDYNKLCK